MKLVRFFFICFALCLIFLMGCSSTEKKQKPMQLSYPPELETVHQLIIERKTDDAQLKINDYLNKSENIHWFGHAYFLKAFLFELDSKLQKSVQYYRSAIQHSNKYNSKVEAKALYNLSFVYEKLENQDEMLVVLVDLMKRREFFDVLTGHVEIPARLAAAYASQSKIKEAKIFHREARQNFKTIVRTEQFRASKEELSKSLYYLGFNVYPEKKGSFESLVEKLSLGQKYFLGSAEASDSSWSKKATSRLIGEYDNVWGMVRTYEQKGFKNDLLAKKKKTQEKQLTMASQFYDLVHQLRAEEFPMSKVNRQSKQIMEASDAWLVKIQKFALSLNLGPEMMRSKKIKNTKLSRFIEKKEKPVLINQEQVKKDAVIAPQLPAKRKNKSDIGKDPNL